MGRCPCCNEVFTCVKTHLWYCTHKPEGEEQHGCRRKEDSTDTQQCPYCDKLFKCLNKHLWRCTAQKQFFENNDNFRRTVLELKLLGRLRKAKVSQKQPESLMSNVNKIRNITLATLKKDCTKFSRLHWEAINSGSYYEGVKVGRKINSITRKGERERERERERGGRERERKRERERERERER